MARPSLAPTHLLHLVDAVSRPVIFGLLLRDTGHSLRPTTAPFHAQPPSLTSLTPYPQADPFWPSCFGSGEWKELR